MKTYFLPVIRARFPVVAALVLFLSGIFPAAAQQWVVNQKDNTRPETTARNSSPAFIRSFTADHFNGYNDVEFTVSTLNDTRKFVLEYSFNALDYLTAGELLADKEIYSFRHRLLDERPVLYRVRFEQLNGKFSYSDPIVLKGIPVAPVQIYPTIITGNTVNINASWPVERIVVTSANGVQVLAKEVNGQRDYISVVVPSVGKGMYWMTFYGRGWKSTEKFIVP
jgi:hypothetical protein